MGLGHRNAERMSDTREKPAGVLVDTSGEVWALMEGAGLASLPIAFERAATLEDAVSAIRSGAAGLVLIHAADGSAETLAVFDRLRAINPHIVQILVADPLQHGVISDAIRHGAADWIPRVEDPERFCQLLDRLITKLGWLSEPLSIESGLREEPEFCRIVGSSTGIRRVLENIRIALPSDVPVLVCGETGTGKELVAQALHYRGPRRKFPLKAVNCASLPETLLESELFGHEKGAFTGAMAQRKGKFELAHKGTLFLDEIGEMSPSVQAKLLRVVEEQRFERIGGSEEIHVNVRLICATNRELRALTEEGKFRQDLFYRIAAFRIELPPLRERPQDIPELAEFFRVRYAAQSGKKISAISEETRRTLVAHDWPGNVRELQNAIRRAILVCRGDVLKPGDFDLGPRAESDAKFIEGLEDGLTRVMVALRRGEVLPLDEVEQIFIRVALEITGGNVSEAAERLGISRSTIYRKIQEYGIPVPRGTGGDS
jgi:two-component system response regulator HydG